MAKHGGARTAMQRVAALAVLALTVSSMPARATVLPPKLLAATGREIAWSNNLNEVAARYDRTLSDLSNATLTDVNGNAVPGASTIQQCTPQKSGPPACAASDVLRFDPSAPMSADTAPYTVTFNGFAKGASAGDLAVGGTFSFLLDTGVPYLPTIEDPQPATSTLAYGPNVALSGRADDRYGTGPDGKPDYSTTSGIARVQLRFYNPAESFDAQHGSTEVMKYHTELSLGCTDSCAPSSTWSTTVTLDPGYWTVEAFSFDAAGNRSPDSQKVSFIVLPVAPPV